MKIKLQRDWYAPGDLLYTRRNGPHEVGDELLPYLPSGAQIEESGKYLTKVATRKKVLTERIRLNLDAATPKLAKNADDAIDDEAIRAEILGESKPAKPAPKPVTPPTAPAPSAPTQPLKPADDPDADDDSDSGLKPQPGAVKK